MIVPSSGPAPCTPPARVRPPCRSAAR